MLKAADREQKHREEVERLKRKGFTDPAMREWTFGNDNGKCPQMHKAYSYVEQWEQISTGNYGLILWGNHQFPSFEQKSESSLKKQYNESDKQS